MEDQPGANQGQINPEKGINAQERELRQHINIVVRERDQAAVQNPDHDMELEGEVRRLAQVIDELQGWWKVPSWRIMLDNESPL